MGIRSLDLCQIGGVPTGCLFLDGLFTTKHTKGHEVVYNLFFLICVLRVLRELRGGIGSNAMA